MSSETVDLLIVGAGPTGIAIGAAAVKANLSVLLVDRGALTNAILNFPTDMTFFTTRDKLEIADIPLTIPDEKPSRQQSLIYYRAVAAHYKLPLALHEEVVSARKEGEIFVVSTRREGKTQKRRARAIAIATGYFDHPYKLCVPGVELPWVYTYYRDPYRHFSEEVVIVGGGNSACEAALDLWRNGAKKVTMVVRADGFKQSVKYWVKPNIENRVSEGAVLAHFNTTVRSFSPLPRGLDVLHADGHHSFIKADAAYVLIGYHPDSELLVRCGVEVDPTSLIPKFNPGTCESNVPGLYIAGTIQAGRATDKIFIENSRDHAPLIVNDLKQKLGP